MVRRNLVVITSQVKPNWKTIDQREIKLEPFGRDQLEVVVGDTWVDRVMDATYLASLARLPYTAQLVAKYIEDHAELPKSHLDVYTNLRAPLESDTQVVNLEIKAWELFCSNERLFESSNALPEDFCRKAVEQQILTAAGNAFRFTHDLTHRFFVSCFLVKQDRRPLAEWHEELVTGLDREYWSDVLELWAEFLAKRAVEDPSQEVVYYQFLRSVGEFSARVLKRVYERQVLRMYSADLLKKNLEFVEWAATKFARAL
jgi:hypothetical protein